MIVDTSALVAVLKSEEGWQALYNALCDEPGLIIAPVLVEFRLVTAQAGNTPSKSADDLLGRLSDYHITIIPFRVDTAYSAAAANQHFGKGNGLGGPLNMIDLMVYAVAKETGRPILCTGKDFSRTDAMIHPASRRDR